MDAEYHALNGDELKKFFLSRVEAIIAEKTAFTDQVAHFGASFECKIKWQNDQADGPREVVFDSSVFNLKDNPQDGSGILGKILSCANRVLADHPDLNMSICHLQPAYTVELTVTSKAARIKKGQSLAALEEPIVDPKTGEKIEPHTATYTDQGVITYPDKVRENLGLQVPGMNYSAAEIGATNVR